MKYRALLRRLERKLPEPPPEEIIVTWVDPDAPKFPTRTSAQHQPAESPKAPPRSPHGRKPPPARRSR